MVNQFHSLIFMQVNVEAECSSSTKLIAYTISSSTNLKEVKVSTTWLVVHIKMFLHCQLTSQKL
jgi:hypothetical protein